MRLTVMHRFVLVNILPDEGGMLDLVTSGNVRKAIEFSEADLASLKLEEADGIMKWDNEAAERITADVEFTGPQTKLIVEQLERLDSEKKLTTSHLGLCELFGIGKET